MPNKIISLFLFEEVADRIQGRIISQELKPGDRIDEQALAEEFGISRTPLREALKVLRAEGLVTFVPRRGCFVARLSDRDLNDIYDIVALLEGRCAAVVAKTASDDDLKRLQLLHDRLEQAATTGDLKRYTDANSTMHATLLELGGNRYQRRIVQNLRRMLMLSYRLTIGLPGRLEQSIEEHRELMAALLARDSARAEQAMNRHMMKQLMARQLHGKQEAVRAANT